MKMVSDAANYELTGKRVFVAGHSGMVGSAILRRLSIENIADLLTVDRRDCDLTNQWAVQGWMAENKPDCVFLAAAKVGGIAANSHYPAEFLYDNLMIEANVIQAALKTKVEKLLFLGSSCIYPRMAPQPISEDALLTGPLEPTNEAYAIAKIAGLKLCAAYRKQYGADFIAAMPTNLYGPGDRYDLENSHVIPALIMKAHTAKTTNAPSMEIWGSGKSRREFLYVDDLADALVFLMKNYSGETAPNIGTGHDITILETAQAVMETIGFKGALRHDRTKPDGAPRKQLDVSLMSRLGWQAKTDLKTGLSRSYQDYLTQIMSKSSGR